MNIHRKVSVRSIIKTVLPWLLQSTNKAGVEGRSQVKFFEKKQHWSTL